ncbi:ThiF family adenylyltransferase [Bradyrhizobium sp. WBAH42]|nr:thiamine biosynthesis protein ThiF [Bradyrhizobium sp. WBAH30]MDD1546857.1 thiamine biosynthesis protein ThiF [Bradyrhizobium sp. WBAH41]MDD1560543.1 thiamine biosynthesis protein ThiF [Bradyrhizobium sp. WBAH23]MDD1567949.1 thiamine biosynthesis protein ThiF [Bradyrhizobium sp. WBAH33]MDD1593929.1 thiamine biosynthesis protein ThiF [Bradyrhizobium sp. WBAH42]NRB91574.1 thiamine biosynthesis protein ThiF [Bradyrhizobium sp. WBAH10]QCJ93060.1 thiamine biosynthesis protein ThiF [Bradyrhizobi
MASNPSIGPWRLTLAEGMYQALTRHLFPGDHDEHGAIILAGICESDRGLRLVARELHLAVDGVDYVPGKYGYRMLKAQFIQSRILRARDLKLAYLAIHNHRGTTSVDFSPADMASHERGYPALLDIARGMPVGALVFADEAVAGDLWFPGLSRAPLASAAVIGSKRLELFPQPPALAMHMPDYDRQSRLFGDRGQAILGRTRVGIIGLGGAGSVLAELLGRLGVGEFVLADPDKAETTNLPRLIAALRTDASPPSWLPAWIREKLRKYKVDMASRNIKRANPNAKVHALPRDFLDADVAARFTDCDYLFLAADTMGARLLFNAVVNQYGIPGVQVGAKIPVSAAGEVGDVFCVARSVRPGHGCLWCNGLINPARLQDEAVPDALKKGYAYLDDPGVTAPSVVTMNAIACAHAADDFLFHMTGLKNDDAETAWFRWNSRKNRASYDVPRQDLECLECSGIDQSRLGRGDHFPLPVRPR